MVLFTKLWSFSWIKSFTLPLFYLQRLRTEQKPYSLFGSWENEGRIREKNRFWVFLNTSPKCQLGSTKQYWTPFFFLSTFSVKPNRSIKTYELRDYLSSESFDGLLGSRSPSHGIVFVLLMVERSIVELLGAGYTSKHLRFSIEK